MKATVLPHPGPVDVTDKGLAENDVSRVKVVRIGNDISLIRVIIAGPNQF